MKKMTIKTLVNAFDFEVLAGESKIDNPIVVYGINRAGLELTGFYNEATETNHNRRAILLSTKENAYMSQFSVEKKREKYIALMNAGSPVIMITQNYTDQTLVDVAKELNFPLLYKEAASTSNLNHDILNVFNEYFAPTEEVHGSLVNILGTGVLIMGQSGIGKSEITLELIKLNHLFVGDDRIIITNENGLLMGKSHPILKNLVEVRGIGIIDVSKTNGYQVILDETPVDMVIELFKFENAKEDKSERIGNKSTLKNILGIKVPYLQIPVSSGRNISNIIETAVAQQKIAAAGYSIDVIELINKRIEEGAE
ncbi:HPr(Ser) kinase/phosphatase [Mesoplasma photuris]|uniref:HPr(Ser) kinase/phosphatase n=1 Tax=Mesoplasma photuris TaxID=217731 RepID=UPI0004E2570B|nr:HPr(Ser) kinase/phosphatase [Mesoplasma photuris]